MYGIQKAIRSHQISNPSVTASVVTGRPNACNQCHLDQTLGWAADALHEWYGTPRSVLTHDQQTVSAGVLWALTGRAGQRALAAWSLGWDAAMEASGADWMPSILTVLLEDPYDSVRFIANRSLRKHEGFGDFAYDFIAAPEARRTTALRARSMLEGRRARARTAFASAVLRDADGALVRADLDRLRALRDDSPENLLE